MPSKKIDFVLSKQDAENFENNLGFVSPYISSFKVLMDKNEIQYELNNQDKHSEVDKKLEELIKKLRPIKENRQKVFFDNLKVLPKNLDDIHEKLMDANFLFEHSPGFYTVRGLPAKMMRGLEERIISFATTFNAEEITLPVSTSVADLKDAHFFKRTPQHANFISILVDDADKISDFSKLMDKEASEIYPYFKSPKHICRTAICSNSYPQFRNKILKSKEYQTWTTFGRAFRNESLMAKGLERLHEFSMRELIFFGNKEFVSNNLAKCLEWFKNFLVEFNIQGIIQTAGDPFYADNARALQFYQQAEESKYEFRLVNPFNQKEISCGSINNHGFHFSKSYNIKLEDGDFATTGCVGFGYERLVFCVLAQYGLDTALWPKSLKVFFAV